MASTRAPARLASWIAAVPTPLAPACTSTVSPAFRWPAWNRQSSAVPNATGITDALPMSNPSGTRQALRAGIERSSAWEPNAFTVATRSPTFR